MEQRVRMNMHDIEGTRVFVDEIALYRKKSIDTLIMYLKSNDRSIRLQYRDENQLKLDLRLLDKY